MVRLLVTLLLTAWMVVVAAPAWAAQVGYKAIGDAIERARELDDAFGGAWLVGDRVVFAFTHRATDEQIAEVLGLVAPGTSVDTVRVDWSEAELEATNEAISDAAAAGQLMFVNGVGTSLPDNAVVVYMYPEYADICQPGITARFGPVHILFVSSRGDVGAEPAPASEASPRPSASPAASLPPGCLPPASPGPSLGALPSDAPTTASPVPTGNSEASEGSWSEDIESMPICPEDVAVDSGVDSHHADPNGPESDCRLPDVIVDGPQKRTVSLDEMTGPEH